MTYRALLASPSAQRNLVLGLLLAVASRLLGMAAAADARGMTTGAAWPAWMPARRWRRRRSGMAASAFLVMWAAMMAAMMFPTAAPMVLAFHRIQSGKRARGEAFVSTWLFVAGYIAVWVAAGIVAYLGALAAERIAALLDLSAGQAARIGGGLLIAAGLYQLTPLKHVCLSKCRSPIGFIMTAWREGRCRRVAHGRGAWRRLSRLLLAADGDPVPARDHEPRGDGARDPGRSSPRRRWPGSASPSTAPPPC